MRRRLLNFVAALSLLACIALAALWVRSRSRDDYCVYAHEWTGGETITSTEVGVSTGPGRLALTLAVRSSSPGPSESIADDSSGWEHTSFPPGVFEVAGMNRSGFGYQYLDNEDDAAVPPGLRSVTLGFPLWLPAALFALPPAVWLYRRLRPRHRRGHCPACGYDLRATPGRCPECGHVIALPSRS